MTATVSDIPSWEYLIARAYAQAQGASTAAERAQLYLAIAAEIRKRDEGQAESFNKYRQAIAQQS